MEQYDVCAARSNMLDQAVSLNRSHGKLKRDQSDFIDDAFKPNSIKVPRHSQLSSVDTSCSPRELPHVSSVAVARSTGELTAASLNINTMSVLPRLLRTMTNGSNGGGGGQPVLTCHDNYILSSSARKTCPAVSSFGTSTDNTDVHSSSASVCLTAAAATTSSFSSTTPTSNSNSSNFISFLSPVAAMAAAALSSSNSNSSFTNGDQRHSGGASGLDSDHQMQSVGGTSSYSGSQETSGLVTLATASSLIERQWLTRTTAAAAAAAAASLTTSSGGGPLPSRSDGLLEPGEAQGQHQVDEQRQQAYTHGVGEPVVGDSRSLVGKLPGGPSVNGGATPVTHAVLDVHSLAALICETQKQCTGSRAAPPGYATLASSTAVATTNLTDSCTNVRMVVATSAPPPEACEPRDRYHHLDGITGHLQQQQGDSQAMLLESSPEAVQAMDQSTSASGKSVAPAATAFISLQPAPGSLLASSNFQQLMASGEFMSPTARQTLLGQTSDGSSRQLYLLVPTDCPVIMSRPSNAQQQPSQTSSATAVDDSLSAGSPPPLILESLTTSTDPASRSRAPILEAISPDVVSVGCPEDEPDAAACAAIIGQLSTAGGLSKLTTVGGSPTALSTLIAGLGANQQHHHQQLVSPTAVAASTPSTSATISWGSADPSLRLPGIGVVSVSTGGGVPGFVHGVAGEQARFRGGEAVAAGDVNALLGAVKSDPDMYTPNGHLYTGPDEIGRFRCYPTTAATVYSHPSTSCVTNGGTGSHSQSSPSGLLLRSNNNASSSSTASAGVANFFHLAASSTSTASSTGAAAAVAVGNDLHHLQHQQHPSLLLSQQTTGGLSASPTGGVATASHFLQHQHHLSSGGIAPSSAVRSSTTSSASLSQAVASMSTKPSVLQPLVIEDPQQQQRHSSASILTPTSVNRIDSTTTAYLEHINSESKDIRRRVSHNEVERRRRDRINTWISELYKLLPPDEQAKSQYQSKGMVLKRVFEYFQNVDSMLNAANTAVEQTRIENGVLRQRVHDLQSENQLLSASLQLGAAAAAVQLKQRQSSSSSSLKGGNGSKSCGDDESGEPANCSSSAMTNGELLPSISVVGHLRNSTAGASGMVRRGDQLVAADYQTLPPVATGSRNGSAVTNGGAGAGTVTLFTVGAGGLVGTEYTGGESSCDPSGAGGHSSPVAISSSVLPTAVNPTGILAAGGGSVGLLRSPVISLPSLELATGAVSTITGNTDGQLTTD